MKKLFALLFLFSLSLFAETIPVFLIGTGHVGGELLAQIQKGFADKIQVVAIGDKDVMLFDENGLDLKNWRNLQLESKTAMSLPLFLEKMEKLKEKRAVFVDCTGEESIAGVYGDVLKKHISVVTPSTKGLTGPYKAYCDLQTLSRQNHVRFLYDASVGAGLPYISTIQSLIQGGDTIVKLEGILSGTLSYLFNQFDGTVSFSELVQEAKKKGITEPDPREDLDGKDMARKFLILAREAGLDLEMSDITIQPFLPEECFTAASVPDFNQKLSECNQKLSEKAKQAKAKNQVLRYIGTLENGKITLSLKAVGPDHPFYDLCDADSILTITSRNYQHPIVIKGLGPGTIVTAAAVLSNIIQTQQ